MKTFFTWNRLVFSLAKVCGLMFFSISNVTGFPSSGTCQLLLAGPLPYGASLPANRMYNLFGTLSFTTANSGMVNFRAMDAKFDTNGVQASEYSPANFSFPFSITDLPSIVGAKRLVTGRIDKELLLNLYSMNSDRTLLVQGANELMNGVCQF